MTRLNDLWAQARSQIRSGRYADRMATPTTIRLTSRKRAYEVGALIGADEVCQRYACHFEIDGVGRSGVFKMARTSSDNDLLQNEAHVVRHLHADKDFARLFPFVPEIYDSFLYDDGRVEPRQANVVGRLPNVYSLEDIHTQYPHGIDPKDAAWLWRKLLIAVGFAHARGIVHGAVLPPHLLVEPDQHGLILDNWLYAVHAPIEPATYLSAIVPAYESWYPPEVFDKQPSLPGLDIFMGARCLVYLLGGDPLTGELPSTVPKALASFFRGCLLPAPQHQPQQAWAVLNDFTQLIERLWGPRTFRPFAMPSV
jgi:serine/threonine protein kinase